MDGLGADSVLEPQTVTARTLPPPAVAELRARLTELMVTDAHRLGRRLSDAQRTKDPARRADALAGTAAAIAQAMARVARRRETRPAMTYPPELPVSQRRDDIAATIRDHQVVVLAGKTGSGKTTQLPKICLELGRGVRGMIGHTQPRRIAARTVAERIAEEIGTELGDVVGYQVRFADQVSNRSLVKVMTDGILLAEIQRDRDLRRYDTIIIDEAHERSLTIDFLLGYFAELLPRRTDLKLIITSATIDPERFSRHFGGAPIIEVSGRTYPVEIRYRPLAVEPVEDDYDDVREPDGIGDPRAVSDRTRGNRPLATVSKGGSRSFDGAGRGRRSRASVSLARTANQPEVRDQTQAIVDAVRELATEGPGDVLVFLSGEREIRDTADALAEEVLPSTEILPLYARLSIAEQHRIFRPHAGRRIVLATNVAETSLTVPGIRCVVDAGTARISRYSNRTKVQRLPIEPISQASANQRAGRCGRLGPGVCIRLYAEDDFLGRPAFTEPEIQRTSLAAVILQMAAMELGDIERFPFVDPPDRRQVRDGLMLLAELGALETQGISTSGGPRLTRLGRRLAQLPLDPRLARMMLAAESDGVVREVIIVVAALSIQDPRERPSDNREAADAFHKRFADDKSDFMGYLNLWAYLREQQKELSSSAFRRLCRAEHLHYLRIREWQDLVAQLRSAAAAIDLDVTSSPGNEDGIHRAVLTGLLSHVGLREERKPDYLGARGARFALNPGSGLFKKPPDWVMAAELVETSRLWARTAAKVDPAWIEELAEHLVVRTYAEPRWSARRGSAVAQEKVTLYGLPVVASRTVAYGRIDPEVSRELFIRHALVEGEWRTHHRFFHANLELIQEVATIENRLRRRDIVVPDEALEAFYDERIPADVVSVRHFDAWWKDARRRDAELLTFTRDLLVADDAELAREADYPDVWQHGDLTLDLSYQFEPGAAEDGVTVHVPMSVLNQVTDAGFDWQVPGLREDLVTALIRSLPKSLRTRFVPAPDRAREALEHLDPASGQPLADALGAELARTTETSVPADAWSLSRVPPHLRMTIRVEAPDGTVLAQSKDIAALQRRLAPEVRLAVAKADPGIERTGIVEWDLGTIPRTVERRVGAQTLRGFPALVDEGGSVALRVQTSETEQWRAMRIGLRRLLTRDAPAPAKIASARLDVAGKLALTHGPQGSMAAVLDDCVAAVVDAIVAENGGPAWDAAGFARLRDAVRARAEPLLVDAIRTVADVVRLVHDVRAALDGLTTPAAQPALVDLRAQLARLVHPGFVTATGVQNLPQLKRYLRAMLRRIEVLPLEPARDDAAMRRVAIMQAELDAVRSRLSPERRDDEPLQRVRWMLEEFRVSLFAQRLGTAYPVSEQRIRRALDEVV